MPKNFIKTKIDTRVAVAIVLIAVAIGVSASIATLIPTIGSGKFYGSEPTVKGECDVSKKDPVDPKRGWNPDCMLIGGGTFCILDDKGLGDCVQCKTSNDCKNYPLVPNTYPGDVCTAENRCICNSNDDCKATNDLFLCRREAGIDKIQQNEFNASKEEGICRSAATTECDNLLPSRGDFHPLADPPYYDQDTFRCTLVGGQFDSPKRCDDVSIGGHEIDEKDNISGKLKCGGSGGGQYRCCKFKGTK